jgi:hypothetical protein
MSTGGDGGADHVGGIEATVSMDTSGITPGLTALQAGLDAAGMRIESLGARAAIATTRVDASMRSAGRAAAGFGNQLQVVGQTLDDFQYIGEMGLRPILNNLMQINPALGIAAIAFDQARKNGEGLAESVKNVGVALLEVAGIAVDLGVKSDIFGPMKESVDKFVDYIKVRIPQAWGELSGSTQRGEEAAAKAFLKAPKASDVTRGKEIASAISEYGADRFFKDVIEPALMAGNNPEVLAKEQKLYLDAIARAKKGDRAAADELVRRTEGTAVGAQIWANLPETKAAKKAEGEAKKVYDKERLEMLAGEAAEAEENEANYKKYLKESGATDYEKSVRGRVLADLARGKDVDVATIEGEAEVAGVALPGGEAEAMLKRVRQELNDELTRRVASGEAVDFDQAKADVAREREKKVFAMDEARAKPMKDMLELQTEHAKRLNDIMKPEERQSQVFAASDLNARVQSSITDGQDEQVKKMDEVRKEIFDFREAMRVLQMQPVRDGGRT